MSQSPTGFALETRAPEILRAALPCGALLGILTGTQVPTHMDTETH